MTLRHPNGETRTIRVAPLPADQRFKVRKDGTIAEIRRSGGRSNGEVAQFAQQARIAYAEKRHGERIQSAMQHRGAWSASQREAFDGPHITGKLSERDRQIVHNAVASVSSPFGGTSWSEQPFPGESPELRRIWEAGDTFLLAQTLTQHDAYLRLEESGWDDLVAASRETYESIVTGTDAEWWESSEGREALSYALAKEDVPSAVQEHLRADISGELLFEVTGMGGGFGREMQELALDLVRSEVMLAELDGGISDIPDRLRAAVAMARDTDFVEGVFSTKSAREELEALATAGCDRIEAVLNEHEGAAPSKILAELYVTLNEPHLSGDERTAAVASLDTKYSMSERVAAHHRVEMYRERLAQLREGIKNEENDVILTAAALGSVSASAPASLSKTGKMLRERSLRIAFVRETRVASVLESGVVTAARTTSEHTARDPELHRLLSQGFKVVSSETGTRVTTSGVASSNPSENSQKQNGSQSKGVPSQHGQQSGGQQSGGQQSGGQQSGGQQSGGQQSGGQQSGGQQSGGQQSGPDYDDDDQRTTGTQSSQQQGSADREQTSSSSATNANSHSEQENQSERTKQSTASPQNDTSAHNDAAPQAKAAEQTEREAAQGHNPESASSSEQRTSQQDATSSAPQQPAEQTTGDDGQRAGGQKSEAGTEQQEAPEAARAGAESGVQEAPADGTKVERSDETSEKDSAASAEESRAKDGSGGRTTGGKPAQASKSGQRTANQTATPPETEQRRNTESGKAQRNQSAATPKNDTAANDTSTGEGRSGELTSLDDGRGTKRQRGERGGRKHQSGDERRAERERDAAQTRRGSSDTVGSDGRGAGVRRDARGDRSTDSERTNYAAQKAAKLLSEIESTKTNRTKTRSGTEVNKEELVEALTTGTDPRPALNSPRERGRLSVVLSPDNSPSTAAWSQTANDFARVLSSMPNTDATVIANSNGQWDVASGTDNHTAMSQHMQDADVMVYLGDKDGEQSVKQLAADGHTVIALNGNTQSSENGDTSPYIEYVERTPRGGAVYWVSGVPVDDPDKWTVAMGKVLQQMRS